MLLSLGRVDEVHEVLHDTLKEAQNGKVDWGFQPDLSLPTFEWFQIVTAAADGDYETADKVLERLEMEVQQRNTQRLPLQAQYYGSVLLMFENSLHPLVKLVKTNMSDQIRETAFHDLQIEGEIKTLRGWLALEAGDIDLARKEFRAVLELSVLRDEHLAASLALGTSYAAAKTQRLPADARVLELPPLPLAASRLRWIEQANR